MRVELVGGISKRLVLAGIGWFSRLFRVLRAVAGRHERDAPRHEQQHEGERTNVDHKEPPFHRSAASILLVQFRNKGGYRFGRAKLGL